MGTGGARPPDVDPFETLAPLAAAATVRIHAPPAGYAPDGPDRRPWGSGFFIAPNWALTCAHVALAGGGGEGGGREVGLSFAGHTARGRVEWAQPRENSSPGPWPAPDLALIRLLEPVPHACVWLSERTAKVFTRRDVAFFGCTEENGQVHDVSGVCSIRGELGTGGWLKLGNEDEIPEGASGGPLVDLERGEVIGVLKARRSSGRDGGLAVSVVQLRRLPSPRGPVAAGRDDLYQRVVHAHDQYHADRHRDDHTLDTTWTDAQSELGAGAGRALTPGQRTELLGLLAELPPPVSTKRLDELLTVLSGRPHDGRLPAPRGWRDGLGQLYGLRQGHPELEALLRYAVHAATAERPFPAPEDAERRLWDWVARTAAAADLPRSFRATLADERAARLRERGTRGEGAPPRPPAETGRARAAPGALTEPFVLLEITRRGWEPEGYDWRVCVGQPEGELGSVDEDLGAKTSDGPPERLRAALAEAFRRADEPEHQAPLQAALPCALLDFPVDEWRLTPDGPPLGTQRPVVVRPSEPHATGEDEPGALGGGLQELLRHRWERAHAGPLEAAVLDCADHRPHQVPGPADLRARRAGVLPVLCRTEGSGAEPGALCRVVAGGHPVVLWRRETLDRGTTCAEFHRGVHGTVTDARGAGLLPGALWRLRAAVGDGTPEAYWSKGLALLYDDPAGSPAGTDDPLEAP
ncbi:trypsin-like peptidase domain-containing protein [Streptomyces sodiiphilus]|uniref:Trypsin-like peptidase domain-containing protein n=1 Tax=Streptomyces sodiiphilus TaxID=226217 RepID=A0ABN2NWP0_9ACTN